ncbi:TPA: hypothetical protein U2I61_003857, partial [Providencia rettgeri]|nr:hypothetical protein [Providencia rettgeri]
KLTITVNSEEEITENGDLNGGNNWDGTYGDGNHWAMNGGFKSLGYGKSGAIVLDDDQIPSSTFSQKVEIPKGGKITTDLGWNNGWGDQNHSGASLKMLLSYNGVSLLELKTPEAKDGIQDDGQIVSEGARYATVTAVNGASFIVNGQTYADGETFDFITWAVDMNISDERNNPEAMASHWTNFVINLPDGALDVDGSNHLKVEVYHDDESTAAGDDIQIGSLKVIKQNEGDDTKVSLQPGSSTKLFANIQVTDPDTTLSKATLTLSNPNTEDTLFVNKASLGDKFTSNYENGVLMLEAVKDADGNMPTIVEWNSLLSTVGIFSKDIGSHTIAITVEDTSGLMSNTEEIQVQIGDSLPSNATAFNFGQFDDKLTILSQENAEQDALPAANELLFSANNKERDIGLADFLNDDSNDKQYSESSVSIAANTLTQSDLNYVAPVVNPLDEDLNQPIMLF